MDDTKVDHLLFPAALPQAADKADHALDQRAAVLRLTPVPDGDGRQRCGVEAFRRYVDHPSGPLAMNAETLHFTTDRADGFIAYRPCGSFLFQLGGVFAPASAQSAILEDFRSMARSRRKHVCAVQLREQDIPLYRKAGFCINQLGTCHSIDLRRFTLSGSRFGKLRNKISQARRSGITVAELGVDLAWSPEFAVAMEAISQSWLAAKGTHTKCIDFMIGELKPPHPAIQRFFAAFQDSALVAFVTFVYAHGRLPGVLHDLTRRMAGTPPEGFTRVTLA